MKITRFLVFYSLSLTLTFASVYPIFASAPKTEKIAFTSNRDGNNEIYIMNPDGTEQMNLTKHKASDAQPAWSPTGKQILFASSRDGLSDLYLMDADGTNVRKVFKDLKLRSAPAWSPDGKQISYTRNDGARELFVASLNEKNEEPIASVGRFDGYSNWSADGTKIVFDAPLRQGNTSSRIHIFDLATRQQEVLLGQVLLTSMNAPVWSPSSDKIVFTWFDGGNSSIYIMNHDGGNPERIVEPLAGFSTDNPDWSPNGNALVYEQYDIGNGNRQIYRVNLNGGEPEKLTRKGINFFADWFDPAFALPVTPQPHLLTTTWGKIKTQD
jgi:Tol biopolymer transport system component